MDLPDSPPSLWLAEYGDYQPEPPLAGDTRVDVAVIGGGFLGMATAIALRRRSPAPSVAVLEAKTVGYGASGRNGSFAMTVTGLGFGTTAMLRGKRFLRRAHSYMEQCVDRLEEFIAEADLDCGKIRPGFLRVATTPAYARRLQKQVRLMSSLGFSGIEWIDADTTRKMVSSARYLGAMWEPRLLLMDPARLVREEKRHAITLGADVYENSPVLAVVRPPRPAGGYRLLTPDGSVSAARLVYATNAYSHLFGELGRLQAPAFTYMIATEPLTSEQLAPIGWDGKQGLEDARNLIHYYRLTPDRRIVMGGGPVGLGRGGDLDRDSDQRAWRHLEQHIAWLWPHLSGIAITHRWGGPFSVTMDLTPALGYLGDDRTAVYGLGCIGHGVAMSYLNGEVLADLLTGDGDGETARQCPFVSRRVLSWPPEPAATAARYAIRGYLQAEDAFHEHLPVRARPAPFPRRQVLSATDPEAPAHGQIHHGQILRVHQTGEPLLRVGKEPPVVQHPARDSANRGKPVAANKFVLKHHQVEVDYTIGVTPGIPALVYQDASTAPKSFTDAQISTEQTGLGTLVSVALVTSVDTGGERFGFFLPQLDVPRGESAEFRTAGVYERFSGPDSIPHRDPSWRCIELHGTAQTVIVPV